MKLVFLSSFLFLCMIGSRAHSTSLGWVGEPIISTIENLPAICLPENAENFPLYRVMVAESYVKKPVYWALYLNPHAQPLILKPGDCVKIGESIEGYRLEGDLTPSSLKGNYAYSFTMDRVRDAQHYLFFYSAAFCVMGDSQSSRKYPQYINLSDGREFIPACDARRNGNISSLHF